MNLFNLVTIITLVALTLQHIINNFLADYLVKRWKNKGDDDNTVTIKRADFVKTCGQMILLLYIIALALSIIGLQVQQS